jgi:VanZ family protein
MRKTLKIGVELLGVLAVFVILTMLRLPQHTFLWREIHNTGHTILFGPLALLFLFLSFALLGRVVRANYLHYAIAFALAAAAGMAFEIYQIWAPGDADIVDWIRDLAGAFPLLVFYMVVARGANKVAIKKGTRITLVAFALAILFAALTPVGVWTAAYLERNASFPVIADFESPLTRKFLRTQGAMLGTVEAPPGWNAASGMVGRLDLLQGRYPGITLEEPFPDWSGYRSLKFDLYSLARQPVNLVVRVSDYHHNNLYNDRFNRNFQIFPGAREIAIPLSDILSAPATRDMDMRRIREITIFAGDTTRNYIVLLDNVRLE